MSVTLWEKCLDSLQDEFSSQQFNTWIRPLQAEISDSKLILLAPNRFVLDWIIEKFLDRIKELVNQLSDSPPPAVILEIGSKRSDMAKSDFIQRPQTDVQALSPSRPKP